MKALVDINRLVEVEVLDTDFIKAASACLAVFGLTKPMALGLTLTDDEGIKAVNRDYRHKDQVTDVLSFPTLTLSPSQLFDENSPAALSAFDSEMKATYLGDILINVQRAREQALDFGHPVFREMTYLFTHGVFHLLGYDHETKEDQQAMRKQEEAALSAAFGPDITDEALLEMARAAREYAHVPYSGYKVGAALLTTSGRVFSGCNIENASFGLTNCAERTAIFKAISEGHSQFAAIAIAADKTAPWPCGACRQVLSEFAPNLRILITWGGGEVAQSSLKELLPHQFSSFTEDNHA